MAKSHLGSFYPRCRVKALVALSPVRTIAMFRAECSCVQVWRNIHVSIP